MYHNCVERPLKIFFSGIAGSGVSAIADFMSQRGNSISGSDRAFDMNPDHCLKKFFLSRGITLFPQDGSGLDSSIDFAVFSTAVESDHPEALRAQELAIPCKTRPEYLAEITGSFRTIAVAGTSGKSTSSGMLAYLMKELGLSPNFIGGGGVKSLQKDGSRGNALSGSSDFLVIEACESDGSIIHYSPEVSIFLNLAFDHHSVEKTAEMFQVLMGKTKKSIIMNADDSNLTPLSGKNRIPFSLNAHSQYRACDIDQKDFSSEFTVNDVRFTLNLPGQFNIYNALSCIAVLSEIDIDLRMIADVLPSFQGIERRFDVHVNDGQRLVIDDYAHNPHKIAALMDTTKNLRDRICYIFQPHGFGPTRMMKSEYINAFADNLRSLDHLILLPIFYAGGSVRRDISSEDLAEGIRTRGKSAEVIEKREEILRRSDDWDNYVILGARDDTLADFAKKMATAF
jgi:UDP-N-acetylmuramate--alanine ligase